MRCSGEDLQQEKGYQLINRLKATMEGKETWGEAGPSAGEQTALCAAGTTSGTQCNKVSS